MNVLKIGILGTRGIPNHYGGFEQVASCLGPGLVSKGHSVTVYNPDRHPYQQKQWKGVRIVHCYEPRWLGTAGQFLYDLNCIMHARKQGYDIVLMLGYTSSSVWGWLYPKKNTVVISNMDGLEWKRSKYNAVTRKFLLQAERWAVHYSQFLVADSLGIQAYLQEKYGVRSRHIAYGAETCDEADESVLDSFGLQKDRYFLVIARMEPENNIAMIIEGYCMSGTDRKLLVVGNIENGFGSQLRKRFAGRAGVLFSAGIYEQPKLAALKKYCNLYFHGHSCGGTNPSLLEAMAGGALVSAHDNAFNRAILGDDGLYFSSAADIGQAIMAGTRRETADAMIARNREKIRLRYNWPVIVEEYERFMQNCYYSIRR
jgi:glycosyltransferase involved in cell wall biosynthesis